MKLKINLSEDKTGQWFAWSEQHTGIAGKGNTPEEATSQFQKAFAYSLDTKTINGMRDARNKTIDVCINAALSTPCKWEEPIRRPCCATTDAIVQNLEALKHTR